MSEPGGQQYLDTLDDAARRRLKETAAQMVKFAQMHAAAIIIT